MLLRLLTAVLLGVAFTCAALTAQSPLAQAPASESTLAIPVEPSEETATLCDLCAFRGLEMHSSDLRDLVFAVDA